MLKRDEVAVPTSCLNKSADDEPIFVLRGKDPATPVTIRMWVEARLLLGKNQPDDDQIREALELAEKASRFRKSLPESPK